MFPNEDGLRWDSCTGWKLNAAWYKGHFLKTFAQRIYIRVFLIFFFVLNSHKIIIFIPYPNFQISTLRDINLGDH